MDLEFFFAYSLGMNKSQEKTITEMTVSEVRKIGELLEIHAQLKSLEMSGKPNYN